MPQSKPVRVMDLPDPCPHGVFLYCEKCGERYSATKGDYFLLRPHHVFQCCRRNMVLARERCTIEEVTFAKG